MSAYHVQRPMLSAYLTCWLGGKQYIREVQRVHLEEGIQKRLQEECSISKAFLKEIAPVTGKPGQKPEQNMGQAVKPQRFVSLKNQADNYSERTNSGTREVTLASKLEQR